MEEEISLLEKKLAEEPIIIPGSPYWEVFKRFGRDESIAMVINVLGTGIISKLVDSKWIKTLAGPVSRRTKDIIVSTSGPVIEKVGFFPAHITEAYNIWHTTPKTERDALTTYFRRAVKGGTKSLIEDIIVHDPLYVGLMYAGLKAYPETPAWMLSTVSFVAAVFAVAGLEVGVTEAAYHNYKRSLKKAGFGTESYLESRFYIRADKNPIEVLEKMVKEFKLGSPKKWSYHDRYFKNQLPVYSGRIPKVRLRHRHCEGPYEEMQSAQIIYTKASEMSRRQLGQYRYFPTKKDKVYFILEQPMPTTIDGIENHKARRILERAQSNGDYHDIRFDRTVAYDPETLLVSADHIKCRKRRPFYVVELKVRTEKNLLKEAMRYVMREFPVVQTTHSKLDLVSMNNK